MFWCWGEEIWTAIGEEEIEEYKVLGAAGGVGYRIKLLEKRKVSTPNKNLVYFYKIGYIGNCRGIHYPSLAVSFSTFTTRS